MKNGKTIFAIVSMSILLLVVGILVYIEEADSNPGFFNATPFRIEGSVLELPITKDGSFLEHLAYSEELSRIICEEKLFRFAGVEAPVTNDGYIYLSQSMDGDWYGDISLDTSGVEGLKECKLCLISESAGEYARSPREVMNKGGEICLAVYDSNRFCTFNLVVTGLPLISINTERIIPVDPASITTLEQYFFADDECLGRIEIFEPRNDKGNYFVCSSRVNYHEKGASSACYDKKSYSFDLLKPNGDKNNVSLLGMREDDSWKLNALVTDSTKLREYLACRIWEQIDEYDKAVAEPGPRGEYAELVMDGDYKGLYLLVEPVDKKKLSLKKKDILYKTVMYHDATSVKAIDEAIRIESPYMHSVRIRYPGEIKNYAAVWEPMRKYSYEFYGEGAKESFYGDRNESLSRLKPLINLDNIVDRYIFNMAVITADNDFKNTFFVARYTKGEYLMEQIPWDLDYTFGNGYADDVSPNVVFEDNEAREDIENAMWYLKYLQDEETADMINIKWADMRASFLDLEVVKNEFLETQSRLELSGALAREGERWPEFGVDTDLSRIFDLMERRMDWLDDNIDHYISFD